MGRGEFLCEGSKLVECGVKAVHDPTTPGKPRGDSFEVIEGFLLNQFFDLREKTKCLLPAANININR